MKRAVLFIALIAILVTANWMPLAHSIPLYVKDLPSSFKDHCTTCHISSSGMGGLNRFGADFEFNGHSIERIAQLDSDRDGFNNGQELSAGTFPGDPGSYSGSEGSGFSGIGLDLIVFIAVAIAAVVTLVWLKSSKL